MADVKWIKITTDVFDDEKVLLIESLPEADSIIVIWFKLLCLAGRQNNSGVFMMNNQIAYTDKMLATIFRRKEATVQLALQTFEQFGMIEVIDGVITIPNWGKHQNLDQLETKKEYMRNYMQEYRAKQKRLLGNSKLCENGLPMEEWAAVLKFFNHECAYCGGKDGLEQEHIIPVNNGGTYRIGNIVPACRKCNASKGSKSVDDWYAKSDVFDQERLNKINLYRCKTNINVLHKTNVRQADKEEDKEREIEKDIDKKYILSDSDESESPSPSKKSKPVKHKHGEYDNVLLTDDELQKLKTEYSDYMQKIENLSCYIASTGKVYKSHYATIRNWARKDAQNPQQKRKEIVPEWMNKPKKNSFQDYDSNEESEFDKQLLQKRIERIKEELGVAE